MIDVINSIDGTWLLFGIVALAVCGIPFLIMAERKKHRHED